MKKAAGCIDLLVWWLEKNIFPKWWFFMVMNTMVQSVKYHQKNKSKFFIGQFWETSTFDGTHVPKQLVINYKSETNLAFFWNLSLETL